MNFSFYSATKHKPPLLLHSEPISIGCEAWIDVSRFSATEKSLHHTARTSSGSSLTKSFADLRKKFRKSSDKDLS
jgi:hypothetical protein